MGTRETGFTASMPGYRAYDDPAAPGRAGRALGRRRGPPAHRAGPGLPRHHQRGHVRARSRASGSSAPTRWCRSPTGRCSSTRFGRLDLLVVQDGFETPDHRPGRRRAARRHLGREGRHVHQQRAAGVAGAGRGGARRARPAPTSTSSWPWPSAGAAGRAVRRVDAAPEDAFEEWRRVSAGRPVRLQRHHLGAHRRRRRGAVAVPGRRPRRARSAARPASTPTAASTTPTAGPGSWPSSPSRSATRPARSTRCCSTPVAPSSTGTPAPRPGRVADPRGPGAGGVGRGPPGRRRGARACAPATWSRCRSSRGEVERIRVPGDRDRPAPARSSSRSTGTSAAPTASPTTSSTRSAGSPTTSSARSASSASDPCG